MHIFRTGRHRFVRVLGVNGADTVLKVKRILRPTHQQAARTSIHSRKYIKRACSPVETCVSSYEINSDSSDTTDDSLRQLGSDGIPGGTVQRHGVGAGDTLQTIAQTYFGGTGAT